MTHPGIALTDQTDRRVMLLRFLLTAVDEIDARGPEPWPDRKSVV